MTTQDLATDALPYARHALKQAKPAIISQIGRAGWVVVWPAWAVITGPMLPILVRLAIELAVGLSAPQLLPFLAILNQLASLISDNYLSDANKTLLADLSELLSTSRSQMLAPVQETLAIPAGLIATIEEGA